MLATGPRIGLTGSNSPQSSVLFGTLLADPLVAVFEDFDAPLRPFFLPLAAPDEEVAARGREETADLRAATMSFAY